MTYVSWAALYEGATDALYFNVLIPRVMEDIVIRDGIRTSIIPPDPAIILERRSPERSAAEICASQSAFHLFFVHSDLGGRSLAASIQDRCHAYCMAANALCNFSEERCIKVTPRHEMEAWALADAAAVAHSIGVNRTARELDIPTTAVEAERLADPKQTLQQALDRHSRGRNRVNSSRILTSIAQAQSLDELRRSESFLQFEEQLKIALKDIGCIRV